MSRSNPEELSFYEVLKAFVINRRQYVKLIILLIVSGIISIVLINIFFDLAEMIGSPRLIRIDDQIMDKVISMRTPARTVWVRGITNLGSAPAYFILVPVSALILFLRGRKWNLAIEASIILLSSSFLNTGLKNIYSRPRPMNDLHLVAVDSYSYPSGHAMSAIVFYGFLIYLSWRLIKNTWIRIMLTLFNLILILGIGISRTYLGVHYPSDVLAGWSAGLGWLIICLVTLRLFHFLRTKNQPISRSNPQNK
jgi:undecaprenyl-diphosphatase